MQFIKNDNEKLFHTGRWLLTNIEIRKEYMFQLTEQPNHVLEI